LIRKGWPFPWARDAPGGRRETPLRGGSGCVWRSSAACDGRAAWLHVPNAPEGTVSYAIVFRDLDVALQGGMNDMRHWSPGTALEGRREGRVRRPLAQRPAGAVAHDGGRAAASRPRTAG
jgi:hypothetical protein